VQYNSSLRRVAGFAAPLGDESFSAHTIGILGQSTAAQVILFVRNK
jgi:hypothetical protein